MIKQLFSKTMVKVLSEIFAIIILGLIGFNVSFGSNQDTDTEVYMGSYNDGTKVYLIIQSVNIQSQSPHTFTCRVRAGQDYLDYTFYPINKVAYYRNSEGYEGKVEADSSPVASSIYRYVVNHW